MASLKETKTRIASVKSTLQITAAMKMVAAAKLRKTQNAFAALKRYAELSGDMLAETSRGAGIAMIISGVAAFFLGIFWYFHTMKKMKEQPRKKEESSEEEKQEQTKESKNKKEKEGSL